MNPNEREGRRWPRFEADARGLVNRAMALRFLWVASAIAIVSAVIVVFEDMPVSRSTLELVVGCLVLLGAACAFATRLVDRVPLRRLVLGSAWACAAVAAVAVLSFGHGAHSLDLAYGPLLVALVAVLVGSGSAALLAGAFALLAAGLGLADALGWISGAAAVAQAPLAHPLSTHALLLVGGLTIGTILLRLNNASYREAHEREQRFRGLLALAAEHYWETDADLRLTRCDDSRTMSPSNLLTASFGRPLAQVLHTLAADRAAAEQALRAVEARQPFAALRLRLAPGADTEWVEVSGHPRHDEQGRFAGYWGVADDVSDAVRREAASRDTAATLATTFEASPDCLALTEASSGRFLMVNRAFEQVFGYARTEVLGKTAAELGTWDRQADRDALAATLRREGHVSGWRAFFRTRAGARLTMQVSARLIQLGATEAILIAARDVTEADRMRLELAAVLQRAPIGIAFTRQRRLVSANPGFEAMFGWAPGSMTGHGAEVVGASDEACAALERDFAERAAQGLPMVVEALLARVDGSRFWCRLQADALDPAAGPDAGTIWIAQDVSAEHAARHELSKARDAAEAASRAKSQFLANTSHEIRTPLNGLLGLARLALAEPLDERRRRAYLHSIQDSAQGLAAIISDILDLSKIEAGQMDVEHTGFDLRELLRALRLGQLPLAQERGLELSLRLDPGLPARVLGDPTRVRQVMANFLSNALKFTPAGSVQISACVNAPGRVRLAVQDSGPGIAASEQQRLFLPFSQLDASTTRRYGGTGLGLSICRELAQLMGGEVGVESEPGAGSLFWLELPLPAAEDPAPPPEATAPEPEAAAALEGAHVLVAEDNPINMMITTELLSEWGAQVAQAADGGAAVDAVIAAASEGRPFDAVLMDVQMPVKSGHEATRDLRATLGPALPPVIALTASALVKEREEAFAAGMSDFITKPIEPERLRAVLARWVRRAN